jgi:hypothetical protein
MSEQKVGPQHLHPCTQTSRAIHLYNITKRQHCESKLGSLFFRFHCCTKFHKLQSVGFCDDNNAYKTNIQLVINHHSSTAVGQVFDVLFYMDAEGQSYDLRQTPLKVWWTWPGGGPCQWSQLGYTSLCLYQSISQIYYTFHFDIEIP